MKRFEYLEHTADVLIRAHGDSSAEAYAAAAEAMFDIISGHAILSPQGQIQVEIEGLDLESLLVRFLSELIVRHEVDRIILGNFLVTRLSGRHLVASADWEPFSDEKHGGGIHVKGVPYHLLEINPEGPSGPASIQVLFDI